MEAMITGNLPDPDQVSNLYATAADTYSTSDAQLAARLGLAVAAASPNQAAIDAALVAFAYATDNRFGLGWALRPDSPAAIFIPGAWLRGKAGEASCCFAQRVLNKRWRRWGFSYPEPGQSPP